VKLLVPSAVDRGENQPPIRDLPMPIFLLLVGVIGLAGLALRVVDLGTIPPGLHFDQAANGLLGLEILGGARPVFFPSYTGREPLFMYLIAGLSALIGPGVIALRLAGALSGAGAVVGLAFLGSVLFNRRVGLAASAFLAGLSWHLHISRLGERTILVPLLDILALLALWLGFRRHSVPLAALGGALVGLQLYTYPSSRFFILALVSIALIEPVANRFSLRAKSRRQSSGVEALAEPSRYPLGPARLKPRLRYPQSLLALGAIATLAAVLVALPLAGYFASHPSEFLGRADQVAIWNSGNAGPSVVAALVQSARQTLGMFFFLGDQDWKYNLGGQPVFDPGTAILFLVGIGVALWRWRGRAERACLIWGIWLLVPGFLSLDAPQFMRTLGAAPAAVLLAALGLDRVVGWVSRVSALQRAAPILWGWPLVAGAIGAYHYFGVWAPSPFAYDALEGDVTAAAQVIRDRSPGYAATYVASRYGPDPTESFLDGDLFGRLHWFDGRSALPLPPPGAGPTLYVLPRTAVDTYWYDQLPADRRVATVLGPDGEPAVEAFVLQPGELPSAPSAPAPSPGIDFAGVARLTGADVPTTVPAGQSILPTLTWQLAGTPEAAMKFFVHLVDQNGQGWAQSDEEVYPAAEWQPGQVLLMHQPFAIPDLVPPGTYTLQVGIERLDGVALAARDAAGQPAGTVWHSPPLTITRPANPPDPTRLALDRRLDIAFGAAAGGAPAGLIRLVGVAGLSPKAQDGDNADLTLYWQVIEPPGNLEVVLQAVDAAGRVVGQVSRAPTGGVWPVRDWQAGDLVADRQRLVIPAGTPPGTLSLKVSLRGSDGQLRQPAGQAAPEVVVGSLLLSARPRPALTVTIGHPQSVTFQNGIHLLGYDVEPAAARPGQSIHLRLYWEATQPVDQSWTVFTHLLDAKSQVRAQQDGLPVGATRPTTTWAPNETIVDPHDLVVQPAATPGADQLEIGLYDAATGRRLPTADGQDRVLLDSPFAVQP
jgi:Dolichyl-phosphate-mannose-protein mannosyltransferase